MDELTSIGVYEWHRYVDDTFVLVQLGTNSYHPLIKFTYEVETDDSLFFLRYASYSFTWATHIRADHLQEADAHRSNDQLEILSFHSSKRKPPSIAWSIEPSPSAQLTCPLTEELAEIRRYGLANGYPRSFIHIHIGVGLSRYMERQVPQTIERQNRLWEGTYVCRGSVHWTHNPVNEAPIPSLVFTTTSRSRHPLLHQTTTIIPDVFS